MNHPRFSLSDVVYIGLGGMLGSLLRWILGVGFEGIFPVPTLLVNILGALALGLLYASQHRLHLQGRYLYMVGFCGSFTTVSLFSMETMDLFRNGHSGLGILNIAVSIGVGLAAVGWVIGPVERAAERKGS